MTCGDVEEERLATEQKELEEEQRKRRERLEASRKNLGIDSIKAKYSSDTGDHTSVSVAQHQQRIGDMELPSRRFATTTSPRPLALPAARQGQTAAGTAGTAVTGSPEGSTGPDGGTGGSTSRSHGAVSSRRPSTVDASAMMAEEGVLALGQGHGSRISVPINGPYHDGTLTQEQLSTIHGHGSSDPMASARSLGQRDGGRGSARGLGGASRLGRRGTDVMDSDSQAMYQHLYSQSQALVPYGPNAPPVSSRRGLSSMGGSGSIQVGPIHSRSASQAGLGQTTGHGAYQHDDIV